MTTVLSHVGFAPSPHRGDLAALEASIGAIADLGADVAELGLFGEDIIAGGRFDGIVIAPNDTVGIATALEEATKEGLLVASVLFMLVAFGRLSTVSFLPALVIVLREILVSGLREYLAALKVSVPVTKLAKWKTTIQMIAIAFLLAGPAGDKIFPFTTQTGLVLLWVAAVVTLYTGYDYFRAGLKHIVDE